MQNFGAYTRETAETRLWLPGRAAVDARIRKVAKAVEDYDESFRLARHEETGDWVVVIGEQGHPVFGWGQELPDPADVERNLSQHDIKRHGRKIMSDLRQAGVASKAKTKAASDEATWQLAEQYEHMFRKMGKHSHPRIFVPRGIPK